jgi:hypothetical protein
MRNLRASAPTGNIPGSGIVDTVLAPAPDAPLASHLAYFRQHHRTQPPWFSAAIARAGELVGGTNEDAIWAHDLVNGAVSGWLVVHRLIGTIAQGNHFWLTRATLVERIVPLLGNPNSNERYIAHVRQHIPAFNGWRPANYLFWHSSLQGVVQLEQLTSAFPGQIMMNAPLSSGKAYVVVLYSRFIREAEARCLTLIPSDATPTLWDEYHPGDALIAPPMPVAIQPPCNG